jgi:threonine dehydrogenase-like Zn-dependent dehydrogenase
MAAAAIGLGHVAAERPLAAAERGEKPSVIWLQFQQRPDIFSTGRSDAEGGVVKVGDSVAIFGQGAIGLCATLGAKLKGASLIFAVDSNESRLAVARRFGATVTLNVDHGDPLPEIKRLTRGCGVDVAIDALGREEMFENALRAIRPGGTLSRLGVRSASSARAA